MENIFMELIFAALSIIILIYSSVLHEIAHGFVAYRLGDPTAKIQGRLTLNPIKHLDLYMSIILPLILYISTGGRFIFGGAKPVPVDPFNLRDGIKDLALVSLVGPLTNVSLAIISSVLIHIIYPEMSFNAVMNDNLFGFILAKTVEWNLILAIFNLMPIPPLDGSKVFALLLPKQMAAAYLSLGNLGMIVLLVLLFFPIGGFSLMGLVYVLINAALSLLGF